MHLRSVLTAMALLCTMVGIDFKLHLAKTINQSINQPMIHLCVLHNNSNQLRHLDWKESDCAFSETTSHSSATSHLNACRPSSSDVVMMLQTQCEVTQIIVHGRRKLLYDR